MEECYFTNNFLKSNTPSWVFFTIFKLCKWYQIVQRMIFFYILSLEVTRRVDFKITPFYLTAKGQYFQFNDFMKMSITDMCKTYLIYTLK